MILNLKKETKVVHMADGVWFVYVPSDMNVTGVEAVYIDGKKYYDMESSEDIEMFHVLAFKGKK